MRNEAEIIWSRAVKKLKSMLNDDVFKLWFAPIKPSQVENGTLILEVANDFCEVWLKDNYHQLLEEVVEDASGQRLQVSYQCKSSSEPSSPQATQSAQANPSESKSIVGHAEGQPSQTDHARRASTPDTATAKFNPFYTFDSFVVGANNRMAYSAALAVAQSPGKSYNPLFLYGGVGLGKTHLLHAIGQQVIGKRPNARVSYLSCEKFTNEFIDGIQNKIHPGDSADKDLYDLPPEEAADIPTVASSLEMALDALDSDRDFLTAGGVFSDDMIDAYIELKREEVERLNMTTHPVEFDMYYSV